MNEKEKITLDKRVVIISVLVLVLLVFGISYAYFVAEGRSEVQTITTSNVGVDFVDGPELMSGTKLKPIKRDEVFANAANKSFTVTNTGTEKMYMHISLENLKISEQLKRYDFVWSLYEDGKNVSNGTFANANNGMKIAEYQVFEVGEEKTYSLYIWIDETGVDQSVMMGQTFNATIKTEGEIYYTSPESDFVVDSNGVLTAYNGPGGEVVIPETVNGTTITSIGMGSFWYEEEETYNRIGKGVTKIVIPNTVTSINNASLNLNNITSLFIPNSVTSIGNYAFQGNPLTFVSIPDSVVSISSEVFSGASLDSIFIPNGVSDIMSSAFKGCTTTNGIVVPESVNNISHGAFLNNNNLSLITVQGKTTLGPSFIWNGLNAEVVYVP